MVFITQLIYIIKGQENVFHQFEDIAIPTILKYNGQLLLRVRPNENSFIEANIERPYEIHFGEFATENDFENFMKDEERNRFLLNLTSSFEKLIFKGFNALFEYNFTSFCFTTLPKIIEDKLNKLAPYYTASNSGRFGVQKT